MDPDETTAEVETPLVDDPLHGGVEDEALEAAAAAQFAPAPETGAEGGDDLAPEAVSEDETGGDTGEVAGTEHVEGEVPSPAATEDLIDLGDGATWTRQQAKDWRDFQTFLEANPEYADRVREALTPQAPTPTPATPPASSTPDVPEGIDLDDPAIAALWNQHVDQLAQMEQLRQTLAAHDTYINQSQLQTTESLVNTARTSYQTEHNLSNEEMGRVFDLTAQLQIIPALMQSADPATGLPRQVDPLAAMNQAFEVARWQIPELREREIESRLEAGKADNKRKKQLSSLGGSSGSVPKSKPEPRNEAERRAAMIEMVAGFQSGQGAAE